MDPGCLRTDRDTGRLNPATAACRTQNRIQLTDTEKEDTTDLLIVYGLNQDPGGWVENALPFLNKHLLPLRFRGIYLVQIIEETLVFPPGKKSHGEPASSREGGDFGVIVHALRDHPEIMLDG